MERKHDPLYINISDSQRVEVSYHQDFNRRYATLEISGLSNEYPDFRLSVNQDKFPLALIDDLYKALRAMETSNGTYHSIEKIVGTFQEILNPNDLAKLVKGMVPSEQVTGDLEVSDLLE